MSKIDIISTTPVDSRQEVFLPYYLGETPEEAEEVYTEFAWLLRVMAGNYANNSNVDLEDYFGEAITGLARAKRDFDDTRGGCSFKTFIILKVKNALNECCRKKSSIVNIPYYVRTAHTYITNIKTILEGYNIHLKSIRYVLTSGELPRFVKFNDKDYKRMEEELGKLSSLAKHSGVVLEHLIKRAEFVPSDMAYDESMTQEELHKRERRKLAAALVVSKLEDHMTEEELHVAQGIKAGKTYAEIGRTHDPKRSIAWVQNKLDEMKTKFKEKMEKGL
ncbi:MAG: hypothetical protein DRP42_06485 [Tenericutes bacterium]|nr:MAG: hypothetical protein DRP42_06485 [Mycoplasmatota bacterium]